MSRELELAKKLALLGWIYRNQLIVKEEYEKAKKKIMGEYGVISFMSIQ